VPQTDPTAALDDASDAVSRAIRASRRALDAGDATAAAPWVDRACRLKPTDPVSRLRLISLCLQLADARAEPLLNALIANYPDFREPRLGLASLLQRRGDAERAGATLAALLARTAPGPDAAFRQVANAIAAGCGAPGWVGADSSGIVTVALPAAGGAALPVVRLDGAKLDLRWLAVEGGALSAELPADWARARRLTAAWAGRTLLGSPVSVAALRRIDGIVEPAPDGLVTGWAWLPGDPEAAPRLRVFRESRPRAVLVVVAADESVTLPAGSGAIRPRGFRIDPATLPGRGPVHVIGPDGRALAGSPCWPIDDWRAGAASAVAAARLFPARPVRRAAEAPQPGRWQPVPVAADGVFPPAAWRAAARTVPPRAPVDVVVPVYQGAAEFAACLRALLRSLPRRARIVVVDDATPDPALRRAVDAAAAARRIVLLRHAENRGFPAAANTGMRHALADGRDRGGRRVRRTFWGARDVVLVNSDVVVPRGWLEALAHVAYSAPDIGACSPFANDASILSYPRVDAANPAPDLREAERVAALFREANGSGAFDLPSAVGHCLYMRRDCLAEVGLFREDLFAQGYGEENDWSLRAARLGWRSVAALGAFVSHRGAASFGAARLELMRRNGAVLERLHPGYTAFAKAFIARDPLAEARRRVDARRWAAARGAARSVVLVTHAEGGGVERHVRERAAALRAERLRPIVLRPAPVESAENESACIVSAGVEADFPNLRYRLPREFDALLRLLEGDRPTHVEIHHLVGHAPVLGKLADRLHVPFDVVLHDSALICPRVNLCNRAHSYCGEPTEVAACEACIADVGSRLGENIGVGDLRARSHELLRAARRVIAPSEDMARRIARYFPDITAAVRPWEDEPPEVAARGGGAPPEGALRVCVVGGITEDKGYDVILQCARDAARRGLPLDFCVAGHTIDDTRLLDSGAAFVTGPYEEADLTELIAAQGAGLGLVPSQCPESWCYALTALWRAGLRVAAFDLGAQAERIRRTGRGFVLPLGLPAARINDALLRFGAAVTTTEPESANAIPDRPLVRAEIDDRLSDQGPIWRRVYQLGQ
jgi:GT2 family glycosyltransferase/glycosyltransferase involved in cell wall biosynthesis